MPDTIKITIHTKRERFGENALTMFADLLACMAYGIPIPRRPPPVRLYLRKPRRAH